MSGREREDLEQGQLKALFEQIRDSKWMKNALPTKQLFQYLWEHRDKPSSTEVLWHEALGEQAAFEADGPSGQRVRDRCRTLRAALDAHASEIRNGWRFGLQLASPNVGYQLEWYQISDPESATRFIWESHVSSRQDVYVVYPKLLFYRHPPSQFTFRYADHNAASEGEALAELKTRHPKMCKDGLTATYSYLDAGHVEARDLLTRWFGRTEVRPLKHAVAQQADKTVAESSSILLGFAATNPLIEEMLSHPHTPCFDFRLKTGGISNEGRYTRILIKKTPQSPDEDEMRRLAPYNPVLVGSDYQIDFSPESDVELGIVCRFPNPYTRTSAPVTIFNMESGRLIYQVARLFTTEERLHKGKEQYDGVKRFPDREGGWPNPMPPCFEILYVVRFGADPRNDREASLEPLAWRIH